MIGTADYCNSATWGEIAAQPSIWRSWASELTALRRRMRNWIVSSGAEEIWLSGAGTSAFVGDLVAAALDGACHLPVRSVPSTDLVVSPRRITGRNPLVISFGRSGNSAESLAVMDALDALAPQARRLNITCNPDSALARRSGLQGRVILLPEAAHDSGFAMTASYSTMLLTALGLLDPAAQDPGRNLASLANRADELLPRYESWAQEIAPPRRIVFTGSGPLQFAAREASLKVMELTGGEVAALWDSSLGFRHGPKSFVLDGTRLVLFQSSDPYAARYDLDLADELSTQFRDVCQTRIGPGQELDTGPGGDAWTSVLYVLAAQILAVKWSAEMEVSVDNPFEGRGTLTRVVSDIAVYDPRTA